MRSARLNWPGSFWGPLVIGLGILLFLGGCSRSPEVVLYCAQDQVFAEPILRAFTRETGVAVRTVFDSEAVKTVGLANRMLAERGRPVGDVFWGNEEFQTRRLASLGVFRETNGWTAFGQRSRRLVSGSNQISWAKGGLIGLTNASLRGRVSLAAPWFGSTASHFAALRAEWGAEVWRAWCRALVANRPFVEEGNSGVVRRVARGEAWVGLTDSDDVQAGQREGKSITAGPELRKLPNTIAVLRGAPHPETAERLYNYLQSPAVREVLVAAGALEMPQSGVPPAAADDWPRMIADFELTVKELRAIWAKPAAPLTHVRSSAEATGESGAVPDKKTVNSELERKGAAASL